MGVYRLKEVQDAIDKIVEFLVPFEELLESHTSEFFTRNLYHNLVSPEMRAELDSLSHKDIMEFPSLKNMEQMKQHESLSRLLGEIYSLRLERVVGFVEIFDCPEVEDLKLGSKFHMNPKKNHEVLMMSHYLNACLRPRHVEHVVDLGSGKGYLSEFLQRYFEFGVVGVEACQANNYAAAKRNLKLSRLWKQVSANQRHLEVPVVSPSCLETVQQDTCARTRGRNTEMELQIAHEFNSQLVKDSYRAITTLVESGFDLDAIVNDKSHALVGLHTCGDLSSNSITLFLDCTSSKSLVNVGCCYNTLTENVPDTEMKRSGYPMSSYLRKMNLTLGLKKSLGCLSPEKNASSVKNPLDKIFKRSLLQLIATEELGVSLDRRQQICKAYLGKSLKMYFQKSISFLGLPSDSLPEDTIHIYESQYEPRKRELLIFNQFRSTFGPVIEALILLDRVLFLLESGLHSSTIVKLFNPVLSPRCYAIVAHKE